MFNVDSLHIQAQVQTTQQPGKRQQCRAMNQRKTQKASTDNEAKEEMANTMSHSALKKYTHGRPQS
jgi:hypothetical protein